MKTYAVDTDEECDRIEYLNERLTFNEISEVIKNHNKRIKKRTETEIADKKENE